jgi:hypothetical protein
MRTEFEEIADLAHDAKKKRERLVSREHIRAELDRATSTLRRLIRAGRRGLPVKTPAPH